MVKCEMCGKEAVNPKGFLFWENLCEKCYTQARSNIDTVLITDKEKDVR